MANLHNTFERHFSQTTRWVYDHKCLVLVIMVLVTAFLAAQLPELTIDTRDESFFHDDDPTLLAYNEF
jgi:predicted RND superfamily exporter protein